MDPEPTVPVLIMMTLAAAASLLVIFSSFLKHIGGHPLVAYEPRRSVPWGPAMALAAMSIPLLNVVVYFSDLKSTSLQESTPQELLFAGWLNVLITLLFAVGLVAWAATYYQADARDLGLPSSGIQFRRDVLIGICATIAAMIPVYTVNLILLEIFKPEVQHPLFDQLNSNHSTAMYLMGFSLAVVAAPIFEEITFRCLLQGWLERQEDEALGFDPEMGLQHSQEIHEKREAFYVEQSLEKATNNPSTPANQVPVRPTHGWIPDLPHGWTPVLISGFAFGLAHIGHGVAPIPLVLFGIMLGYLYQRTHRLTPCIVAHMFFNSFSMLVSWLQHLTSSVS